MTDIMQTLNNIQFLYISYPLMSGNITFLLYRKSIKHKIMRRTLSLILCAPYVIISGNTPILIFSAVILARMGMNAYMRTYYNFLKSVVSVNIHICKRKSEF
jgi:hypothetical protein